MSSSGRRPRSSFGPVRQPSVNQRPCKRKVDDSAEDLNDSFGPNVSMVFRGTESDDDLDLDQRSGKHHKVDLSLLAAGRRPNTRPVRQAALKSHCGRRLSLRLSQNFKKDSKNSMAESLIRSNTFENATNAPAKFVVHEVDSAEDIQSLSERILHKEIRRYDHKLQQQQLLPSHLQKPIKFPKFRIYKKPAGQPLDDVTSVVLNNEGSKCYEVDNSFIINEGDIGALEPLLLDRILRELKPTIIQEGGPSSQGQDSVYLVPCCFFREIFAQEDSGGAKKPADEIKQINNQIKNRVTISITGQNEQAPSTKPSSNTSASNQGSSSGSTAATEQPQSSSRVEVPRSVTPECSPCATSGEREPPLQVPRPTALPSTSLVRITCKQRASPLPPLTWADRHQVWRQMCKKDDIYQRSDDMLDRHPMIHHRMRAILLDWLSEVCEVYKLHRETYHLALDFIDRYLHVTNGVPKGCLQLLGITSLFLAAKIEEIYPPKISEFAYVTDGACKEEEIIEKETIIIKTLTWNLSPITCNTWLNTYLQLLQEITRTGGTATTVKDTEFIYQRFSGETFVQICRLLDLCLLETSCLQFSPALLAASAVSYFFGSSVACRVSGFSTDSLTPAQRWMKPFAMVIQSMTEPAPLKVFRGVAPDDNHNIQTKSVSLVELELAQNFMKDIEAAQEREAEKAKKLEQQKQALFVSQQQRSWQKESPSAALQSIVSVLTPPKTDEKLELGSQGPAATATSSSALPRPVYNGAGVLECMET